MKFGYVANQHEDLYVGRIDWQKSAKNSIFGRFSAGYLNVASTYDGKNPLTINTFGVNDLDYQFAIGDTYLIGSNLVSTFRASASRTNIAKKPDIYNDPFAWPKIWHANRDLIHNPDVIQPGWQLSINKSPVTEQDKDMTGYRHRHTH